MYGSSRRDSGSAPVAGSSAKVGAFLFLVLNQESRTVLVLQRTAAWGGQSGHSYPSNRRLHGRDMATVVVFLCGPCPNPVGRLCIKADNNSLSTMPVKLYYFKCGSVVTSLYVSFAWRLEFANKWSCAKRIYLYACLCHVRGLAWYCTHACRFGVTTTPAFSWPGETQEPCSMLHGMPPEL